METEIRQPFDLYTQLINFQNNPSADVHKSKNLTILIGDGNIYSLIVCNKMEDD